MQHEPIFNYKEYVLQGEKYMAQGVINTQGMHPMDVQYLVDHETEHLCIQVSRRIFNTEAREAHYHLQVYSNPWQHFKALYAPNWFKSKFPVAYKLETHTLNVKAYFPEIEALGGEYRFRVVNSTKVNND
jgi:hypothetical protein